MKYKYLFSFLLSLCSVAIIEAHDTCFVSLHIENAKVPFEVIADESGTLGGMIAYGLNGDTYLYTSKPFVKIINESGKNMRRRDNGEYRTLVFDCGDATIYDYVANKEHEAHFMPKQVNNFKNYIYLGGDLDQNICWVQLEKNIKFRRTFQIRQMNGEFGGLSNIAFTVKDEGKPDSLFCFADSHRVDTLVLYPGQTISRIAVTRGANGVLRKILVDGSELETQYTFRNSERVDSVDLITARTATMATASSLFGITEPCQIVLEYSYMEGEGEPVVENKQICVVRGVVPVAALAEEKLPVWFWPVVAALVLLVGVIAYYVRRYQRKKAGLIPETDKEKAARLTKEAKTLNTVIADLRKVREVLLTDKDNLEQEVATLNNALTYSKNETRQITDECNNVKGCLQQLQQEHEKVQSQLETAKLRIEAFENDNEIARQIAIITAEKDKAIAEAVHEKDLAIAAAIAEKEQFLTAAKQEKEDFMAAAKQEKEQFVANAKQEKEQAIAAIEQKTQDEIAAVRNEAEAEVARQQNIALNATDFNNLTIDDYIKRTQQNLNSICVLLESLTNTFVASHLENNHFNVVSHMNMKANAFRQWFEKEIVASQQQHKKSIAEIRKELQEQLLPLLSNNYSWISELCRFKAYTAISSQAKEEFERCGIPDGYIQMAFAQTCTLLGRIDITLLIPELFVDRFNSENHKKNNAPLINSFFSHGFVEYNPAAKDIVYDVLHPGYFLNGEVQLLPDVCVF